MLDETTVSDTDYIVTTGASTCEVALGSMSDPAVSTGHKVRYRLSATSGGITVRLRQGTTTIATWTHAPAPSSLTTYEQTLTGGEADSITNYAALKLQFEATT
jgi:diphthamide biosynthesis methyltransferase